MPKRKLSTEPEPKTLQKGLQDKWMKLNKRKSLEI